MSKKYCTKNCANKKYFNKLESGKIYSLIRTNPHQAAVEYKEYLKRYPEDYYAQLLYIYVLNMIGQTKKATEQLKIAIDSSEQNTHFQNSFERVKEFNKSVAMRRLEILANEEKYEEAYDFYNKNHELLGSTDVDIFLFRCLKMMEKLDLSEIQNARYSLKQAVDYSEELFLRHIKKHTPEQNSGFNDYLFEENFPIMKVYEEAKKYIPSNKKLIESLSTDLYAFKYDLCGKYKNKFQNRFIVITNHNTDEFITMCPSYDCDELPYVDLNYLANTKETQKVKTLSQIEKFNRRYRNNNKQ